MDAVCKQPECTVGQTGICVLNNDAATCPERVDLLQPEVGDELALPSPEVRPRFHSASELGLADANRLMAQRYCHVIGILGAPKAGKTALLVSLYLLAAVNKLNGFRFADSLSLMAFERLSQGARKWGTGAMPAQMTTHTSLADPRQPGFLHLRLRRTAGTSVYDILLPDLPGEWTDEFLNRNVRKRLEMLLRSDALWIVVDGAKLSAPATRNETIHRTKLIFERIVEFCGPVQVPVLLLLTRLDTVVAPQNAVDQLIAHGKSVGLSVKSIGVASFSDSDQTAPGTGLAETIEQSVTGVRDHGSRTASQEGSLGIDVHARHFLRSRMG